MSVCFRIRIRISLISVFNSFESNQSQIESIIAHARASPSQDFPSTKTQRQSTKETYQRTLSVSLQVSVPPPINGNMCLFLECLSRVELSNPRHLTLDAEHCRVKLTRIDLIFSGLCASGDRGEGGEISQIAPSEEPGVLAVYRGLGQGRHNYQGAQGADVQRAG
jgi:hypothetical protein